MATKKYIKELAKFLKYSATRPYMGLLTFKNAHDGYRCMCKTKYFDNPRREQLLTVGHVDGDEICRALWNEMTYNPVRFGDVNPFAHGLTHFCNNKLPDNLCKNAYGVLRRLQELLASFLEKGPENLSRPDGQLVLYLRQDNSGNYHPGNNYERVKCLRTCIQLIAATNVQDLNKPEYFAAIEHQIKLRHPDGVRRDVPLTQAAPQARAPIAHVQQPTAPQRPNAAPMPQTPVSKPINATVPDAVKKESYVVPFPIMDKEFMDETREDNARESAEITYSTRQYRNEQDCLQAEHDLERLAQLKSDDVNEVVTVNAPNTDTKQTNVTPVADYKDQTDAEFMDEVREDNARESAEITRSTWQYRTRRDHLQALYDLEKLSKQR